MTIKDVLLELINKYGEEFNWYLLPITDKCFVSELKREIGKKHPLQEKSISAVAKCASNDDVLYMTLNDTGRNIYYIFHLTYSDEKVDGFPKCERFTDTLAVKSFIEQSFITDYI